MPEITAPHREEPNEMIPDLRQPTTNLSTMEVTIMTSTTSQSQRERKMRETRIEDLATEPIIIRLAHELDVLGVDPERLHDRWGKVDNRFADAIWEEVTRRDENGWVLLPAMAADEPAVAVLRRLSELQR